MDDRQQLEHMDDLMEAAGIPAATPTDTARAAWPEIDAAELGTPVRQVYDQFAPMLQNEGTRALPLLKQVEKQLKQEAQAALEDWKQVYQLSQERMEEWQQEYEEQEKILRMTALEQHAAARERLRALEREAGHPSLLKDAYMVLRMKWRALRRLRREYLLTFSVPALDRYEESLRQEERRGDEYARLVAPFIDEARNLTHAYALALSVKSDGSLDCEKVGQMRKKENKGDQDNVRQEWERCGYKDSNGSRTERLERLKKRIKWYADEGIRPQR